MSDFYDDLIFPPSISLFAFAGKRSRSATVVEVQSGFDQRRSLRALTQRSYDAGLVARPMSQWHEIDDFFEITDGQTIGFLLQDPTDFQVKQSQGFVAQVMGDAYCLQAVRTRGAHAVYRPISKPSATGFVLYLTRAGVTTIVSTSKYSLDATTGAVQFVAGYRMPGDTFAWSGSFYVPCRFTTNDLDWKVNDRGGSELIMSGPSVPISEILTTPLLYLAPT